MSQAAIFSAILATILLTFSSGERIGYGNTDLDKEWSYIWYENEPFNLYCNSSALNVQSPDYIRWEKPSKDGGKLTFEKKHNDDNYAIQEYFGVEGFQLRVKKVTAETSGVFVCRVHNYTTGSARADSIVGINIRERRYDDMFDKYRSHFIVAVIATAVFLVPLATICFVYHYRYERRSGQNMSYPVTGRDHAAKTYPDGLADGEGGYENPDFKQEDINPTRL